MQVFNDSKTYTFNSSFSYITGFGKITDDGKEPGNNFSCNSGCIFNAKLMYFMGTDTFLKAFSVT